MKNTIYLLWKALKPTAIHLDTALLTLSEGESKNVKVTFTPNNATERDLIWDTAGIAKVEFAGISDTWKITGLKEGQASITASLSVDRSINTSLNLIVTPNIIHNLTIVQKGMYEIGTLLRFESLLQDPSASAVFSIRHLGSGSETLVTKYNGNTAWAEYTPRMIGTYEVTILVDYNGIPYSRTITFEVFRNGGGGCNVFGSGIVILLLAALGLITIRR